MTKHRTHDLLLWIAATDATFDRVELAGGAALVGKCIHCNSKHSLMLSGQPITRATVEHIVPQCHGGDDRLENLAIACSRCNGGKGIRHDHSRFDDPKLQAMIALLQRRRQERMRAPPEDLGVTLPPYRAPAPSGPGPGKPRRQQRGRR